MACKASLIALSIATSASMLTGCASWTRPQPSLTAARVKVDQSLLATPAELPSSQRQSDGAMTGGQCQASLFDLYDVAGKIRSDFIALQTQTKAAEAGE